MNSRLLLVACALVACAVVSLAAPAPHTAAAAAPVAQHRLRRHSIVEPLCPEGQIAIRSGRCVDVIHKRETSDKIRTRRSPHGPLVLSIQCPVNYIPRPNGECVPVPNINLKPQADTFELSRVRRSGTVFTGTRTCPKGSRTLPNGDCIKPAILADVMPMSVRAIKKIAVSVSGLIKGAYSFRACLGYDEDDGRVELDYPRNMAMWEGVGYNIDSVFQWKDGKHNLS